MAFGVILAFRARHNLARLTLTYRTQDRTHSRIGAHSMIQGQKAWGLPYKGWEYRDFNNKGLYANNR